MPLIYFALGFICAQIDYGQLSAAMFFVITFFIHISRYNHRSDIENRQRKAKERSISNCG